MIWKMPIIVIIVAANVMPPTAHPEGGRALAETCGALSGGRRLTPGGSLPARTSGALHRARIESRGRPPAVRQVVPPPARDADLHLLRSFGREAAERLRRIGRGASTRQGVRAPVDRHGDPRSQQPERVDGAPDRERSRREPRAQPPSRRGAIERASASISGKRSAGEVHLPRPVDQVAEQRVCTHRRAGARVQRVARSSRLRPRPRRRRRPRGRPETGAAAASRLAGRRPSFRVGSRRSEPRSRWS